MDGIYGFERPETRFLSNFYPAVITYAGITYPTSEHAYQAAKTLDIDMRQQIANLKTPGQAKRAGQQVEKRADWETEKRRIMKDILRLKFQIPDLYYKLLGTDTLYLEETNTWNDTYWGVCRGAGANNLGHILMEIREEIN